MMNMMSFTSMCIFSFAFMIRMSRQTFDIYRIIDCLIYMCRATQTTTHIRMFFDIDNVLNLLQSSWTAESFS